MPALSNPRHERFCQELAKGKSATEAYGLAGYKPNSGNAATLKAEQSILDRVADLIAEHAEAHRQATQMATERLSIDREWVLAQLVENAGLAKQQGDIGPSNQALNLIGKELGMFVERTENVNIEHVVSDDLPTAEEWETEHGTAH